MTKKDFFRILIKVFGLYSLILSLFSFFPQNITNVYFSKDDFWMLFIIFTSFLLLITLFISLLFKTDFIIDKLKLTNSFDDDQIIIGNLDTLSIFKFAIILIGGLMIIDTFPKFLMDIINEFKLNVSNFPIKNYESNYFWFGVRFINLLFGYLLLTNCKSVAKFLNKD